MYKRNTISIVSQANKNHYDKDNIKLAEEDERVGEVSDEKVEQGERQ